MPDIKLLRARAKTLEPLVRIGKQGITDSIVAEIKQQLKKKKLIKIKILSNLAKKADKKALVQELADKTDAIVVEQVGFVAVLYKKTK